MALQYAGGFEVLLANSGMDAIKCAKEYRPDAILMDIVMHDLDGLSVFRKLRDQSETGNIPVIFHTARAGPVETRNLLSSGARGIIEKPSNPLELGNEIQRILALGDEVPQGAP
jgi:CheY-like chemotaxis protein